MRQVIVLGSGSAGLTAAIYATRAALHPLVFAGAEAGGQLMLTTDVENYPGFADPILGPTLMAAMRTQAERIGAEFINEDATAVDLTQRPFRVTSANGQTHETQALIIATGAKAKLLGLPRETQQFRFGAGGDDQRLGFVRLAVCAGDTKGALREIDRRRVLVDELRANPFGLRAHRRHESRAENGIGESRVVFDIGRQHQLPPRLGPGEDQRVQSGPRRVDGGGQPGRPRS